MWVLLSDLIFLGFLIVLGYAMERTWSRWRSRSSKHIDAPNSNRSKQFKR